ncbi:hypothetical protein HU200_034590 [Digitaria exilis]|uniref:Uncharacterized protein n=1 Tax=Digitaria exilis TaxID=1010633 RepID=A0A835BJE6_9POAL|nr:hypothetical protein HU200_034590 [Digitaria exilis]
MDLVVGASNNAVKSLVNKLGSLLAQEYTLIGGVRDDIQYINDELTSMQAFLNRLKREPGGHDEQRQDWMKQVREVSYDIEDCIDGVDHRLSGEPRGTGMVMNLRKKWYLFTTFYARHCIATEIGNLKTRAQHVSERRMRYGVKELENDGGPAGPSAPPDRPTPPPQLIGTKEPVGMEEVMAKLQKWFDQRNQPGTNDLQRFFAIAGPGGLGKTTVAMAFYRKFGFEFDCRACVLASQTFDILTVLRSLVKQFHEQQSDASQDPLGSIEDWNVKQLKGKLLEQIQGTSTSVVTPAVLSVPIMIDRYIILVDDIWSVSAWESLRDYLPKQGGSIVVTTRFNSVAEACRRQEGEFHKLEPLSDESSCRLFNEIISSTAVDGPHELTPDEKSVMLKCTGRLPLAIVLVAGLVSTKVKSEPRWTIHGHLVKVENAFSAVLGEGVNLTSEGVTQILMHCYNDLPPDMKTCLLYLSMFPKGCQISRKRLIRRWIAEGFITGNHGRTVEEVADDCVNELIGRNIIQATNNSSNGKVKNCYIHDMVLEYIVFKSNDENFITIVGGHWQTPFPTYKVRRLSVHKSDGKEKETVEKMKLSHVRSLTALGSFKALHSTLHKFQILQVLDLEGCKDLSSKELKKICKMHQLKYLSLRRTEVKSIPSKIGRLEALQVLDIRETGIRELPESVDRLQRMEHLLAGNKNKVHDALKLTEAITKMTALHTLSGVEICTGSGKELLRALQNLTNLKKFTIYKVGRFINGNDELLLSAIEHLSSCSLKYLAIDDDFTGFLDSSLNASQAPPEHLRTLGLSGKLSQLPKWIGSLHNLETLTLSITSLRTDSLLVLSELPELFSLIYSLDSTKKDASVLKILHDNTLKSGGMIFVPAGGFKKLKLLRFAAPVLPPLRFLKGAMPGLQRIELRFRMVEGVYGLENLEILQQVFLTISSQAPKDAKAKASQIKELASMVRHKLNNAPSVVLDEYNESSEQK